MKRILLYILLLALLLALLSACSSGSSESDEDGSYGSASGAGDTGGPESDDEQYEASAVERYDPERDGYYIEEEQTAEDEEGAAEAQALEDPGPPIDGYIPEGEALAGEPYSVMEGVTEIPRKDRRYLCGYATHVFVGDVIEQTTTDPIAAEPFESEPDAPPIPATQFIVKLASGTSMIKGSWVSGSQVTATDLQTGYVVNQVGGDEGNGLELMEGDPLLIPGQRYLFATNYDVDNNWYWLVVQPEGDARITSDAERDRAIRDFKKGCHYEVTPEDVQASVDNDEELTVDEQYSSGEDPDYVLREED